jgi:hypothetical protein
MGKKRRKTLFSPKMKLLQSDVRPSNTAIVPVPSAEVIPVDGEERSIDQSPAEDTAELEVVTSASLQIPLSGLSSAHSSQSDGSSEDSDERLTNIRSAVVAEKRTYDFLLNHVSRRLSEITAQKNKMQNEVEEILGSVERVMKEIAAIQHAPGDFENIPIVSGTRGPPLPTQQDSFYKACENGQIHGFNSKNGQRQRSNYFYKKY